MVEGVWFSAHFLRGCSSALTCRPKVIGPRQAVLLVAVGRVLPQPWMDGWMTLQFSSSQGPSCRVQQHWH